MSVAPQPVVVVVEDAEDAMQILVELLEHHGFRAHRARNGAEALVKVDALRPDAILLDLSLPLLDGWSVARAVRAHPATAANPIVALTAHATLPELTRARTAGCDAVFVKPAPHEVLLLEIRRLIRRGRDQSGAHPRGVDPPRRARER